MLFAALDTVPKPANVGDPNPLTIRDVKRERKIQGAGRRGRPRGKGSQPVRRRADAGLGLPVPELVEQGPPGVKRFAFELDGVPPGTNPEGAAFKLTLVGGRPFLRVQHQSRMAARATQPNFKRIVDTRRRRRPAAPWEFGLAVIDSPSATASSAGLVGRLRLLLAGSNEASLTRRLAGTIFLIRIASAALAYLSQILLARWMGGSDYGVYVLRLDLGPAARQHDGFRDLCFGTERSFRSIAPVASTRCCAASSPAAAG